MCDLISIKILLKIRRIPEGNFQEIYLGLPKEASKNNQDFFKKRRYFGTNWRMISCKLEYKEYKEYTNIRRNFLNYFEEEFLE